MFIKKTILLSTLAACLLLNSCYSDKQIELDGKPENASTIPDSVESKTPPLLPE